MTKHYASGDVNNQGMDPAALAAGFNLADVGDADTLKSLPSGTQGLYFLNEAQGVTDSFVSQMNAIKGDSKLFGVYLADEPDPSSVSAASLKAESDWIHTNMPGVKTFIVADNQGSNTDPDFHNYYTQASTHIDLWGLDVYPFRTEVSNGDVTEVDRTVAAAKSQIGITTSQIVPVFQAFGGGDYPDGDGGKWSLPTPQQEKALIAEWQKFAPNPVFDYAYSWDQQQGDNPLSKDAALIDVLKQHNAGQSSSSPSTPVTSNPTPVTPSKPSGGQTGSSTTGHHHRSHDNSAHSAQKTADTTPAHSSSSADHTDTFVFKDLKGVGPSGNTNSAHATAHTLATPASAATDHVSAPGAGATTTALYDGHQDHLSQSHHDTHLAFQDHHLV